MGIRTRQLLARLYEKTGQGERQQAVLRSLGEKLIYSHWALPAEEKSKIYQSILNRYLGRQEQNTRFWLGLSASQKKLMSWQQTTKHQALSEILSRIRDNQKIETGGIFYIHFSTKTGHLGNCPIYWAFFKIDYSLLRNTPDKSGNYKGQKLRHVFVLKCQEILSLNPFILKHCSRKNNP